MHKSLKVVLLIIYSFYLSGCNTVAGIGDDIKKSAEWTKEQMSTVEIKK